jgi:micrococcal nuclease
MKDRWPTLILICALPCRAFAGPLPDCAGSVEVRNAHVARVEPTNDVLVLSDGRSAHLEGIRFPRADRDRAPAFIAEKARQAVEAMTRGRTLAIAAVAPKEDRYGRLRGQVFSGDGAWLQLGLVKNGLARVDISPDRAECAAELYAVETAARATGTGLWALPAYRVRAPNGLRGDIDAFEIVEGKVFTAEVKNGRAYLDFGSDWRSDFTVTVAPEDMRNFRSAGVDPRDYAGKTIRVRGIVQQFHGPEIEVANPQQVEVVQ